VTDESGTTRTTGPVASADAVLVPWPGDPLGSRARRTVRVRVTGRDGSSSGWSEPLAIEAGLLEPADWTAAFASPDVGEMGPPCCAPGSRRRPMSPGPGST